MELVWNWYGAGMELVGYLGRAWVVLGPCLGVTSRNMLPLLGRLKVTMTKPPSHRHVGFFNALLAAGIHDALCAAAPAFQIGGFVEGFGNL